MATITAGRLFGTSEPGSGYVVPTLRPASLLDLSKSNPNETGIDRSWENKWKGLGFSKGITDPGVPGPDEATSNRLQPFIRLFSLLFANIEGA